MSSSDAANAARARQLLETQSLIEDAQRQLLMLPDIRPDNKAALKSAQDVLEECNYALHKCENAWKLQDQLQQSQLQPPPPQQQQKPQQQQQLDASS